MMLKRLGYKVLTASSPTKAVSFIENSKTKIDLLITDITMPELNGKELSKILQSLIPNLKILYMSGYTNSVITQEDGFSDGNFNFIQKPFTHKALGEKVRESL